MNTQLENAIKHWTYVAPLLQYPKSHKAFDAMVKQLDELLNIIGSDEKHPLSDLADLLSQQIEEYENENFHISTKNKSIESLKYLMKSHHLKQTDLPEIGSQGVVSEIINGKRKLNLRQIKALSRRFHVAPTTFMDE